MTLINTINDLDKLYEASPISTSAGYKCPVCGAIRKTEKGIISHMDKQDCYDVKALFAFTPHEEKAFGFYQEVMAVWKPKARISPNLFRKNKAYSLFVRFTVFCTLHEVKDQELYFAWLRDSGNRKTINGILSAGLIEENLRDYRKWLMSEPEWIDSDSFVSRYADDMKQDDHFLIRSLEKAHVALKELIKIDGLDLKTLEERLPIDYRIRLNEVASFSEL